MDNVLVVLVVLMVVVMLAIWKLYMTEVNGKSFLVGVSLYLLFSVVFASVVGKIMMKMKITEKENWLKMIIVYFVVGIPAIFMMMSNSFGINHLGLLMLLGVTGMMLGALSRYADNVEMGMMVTCGLFLMVTVIVWLSDVERLKVYAGMVNWLVLLLLGVIIVEIVNIVCFGSERMFNMTSIVVVCLMIGLLLSDMSGILLKADNLTCKDHVCINYPNKVAGMYLDLVNIFSRLLNVK